MGLISAVKAGLLSGDNQNATAANTNAESRATTQASGGTVRCEAQNAPVVQESVHQREREEITPVVQRDREETIVNQVVQPVLDSRKETIHHQATSAPVTNEVVEDVSGAEAEKYQRNRAQFNSSRTVAGTTQSSHVNAPIISENVNTHVVEEIQPVIQREVQEEHIIHREQPVYERVVKAPVVGEVRHNAPISIDEFEAKGGSATGTGLHCERV